MSVVMHALIHIDCLTAWCVFRYKMRDWSGSAYNNVLEQLNKPVNVIPPHPAQAHSSAQMQHMYNQQMMQAGQVGPFRFPNPEVAL